MVRFDTATGAYELFVIGENGPVSVGYGNSSYNTSGGAAYISGIYTHAWGETEYSMSGIEFIDGMDSYYEGKPVTLDVKYIEGEAVITGLEAYDNHGDFDAYRVNGSGCRFVVGPLQYITSSVPPSLSVIVTHSMRSTLTCRARFAHCETPLSISFAAQNLSVPPITDFCRLISLFLLRILIFFMFLLIYNLPLSIYNNAWKGMRQQ